MTDILGWLGPAVAAVVFLGTATVYLRGSRDRGTIARNQAVQESQERRIKQLEGDLSRSEQWKASIEAQLATVKSENAHLVTLVTARHDIERLQKSIDDLTVSLSIDHADAMDKLAVGLAAVQTLHADLGKIHDAVNANGGPG